MLIHDSHRQADSRFVSLNVILEHRFDFGLGEATVRRSVNIGRRDYFLLNAFRPRDRQVDKTCERKKTEANPFNAYSVRIDNGHEGSSVPLGLWDFKLGNPSLKKIGPGLFL